MSDCLSADIYDFMCQFSMPIFCSFENAISCSLVRIAVISLKIQQYLLLNDVSDYRISEVVVIAFGNAKSVVCVAAERDCDECGDDVGSVLTFRLLSQDYCSQLGSTQ